MHKLIIILIIVAFCLAFAKIEENPGRPRNIILLIGDGMGLAQMSSAYFYGSGEPHFSRFPVVGLSKTSSSREKITDSAAGATAISSGVKTYNGAIGLDNDSNAVETLLEYFEKRDFNTALISTSSITHATPASFYAHVDSRRKEYEIAAQLVNSPVDFFAGGGIRYFRDSQYNQGLFDKLGKDNRVVDTVSLLEKDQLRADKRYGFLLADDGMPPVGEKRGNFLQHATSLALAYLHRKEAPFFMMVEGSQIDWGGHANDAAYVISEVIDFDKAIGTALDFAERDGNTLVIVTADHETGGFALSSKQEKIPFQGMQSDYNSISPTFSTGGHTASMVPVLAYGPGAEEFAGIYPNTDIHSRILELTIK